MVRQTTNVRKLLYTLFPAGLRGQNRFALDNHPAAALQGLISSRRTIALFAFAPCRVPVTSG
jgi:hypothetical protein